MLTVEVNGNVYEQAVSVSVSRSIHNFMGHFQVTSSADPDNTLPIKAGDAVQILADGSVILNGFIDRLRMTQSSTNHIINFGGRDRTSDAYDSSVFDQKSFQGPISFKDVLRNVLDGNRLQGIEIIDEAGDIEDFGETEIIGAEVGETIFNFLEPYARKQQFIFTTNEEGNILLMRTGTQRLGIDLTRLINSTENNILRSSVSIDIEKRFNTYVARSQLNPFAQGDEATPAMIVDQNGQTLDQSIRTSRILEFNTEEDLDNDNSFNRAEFEANVRRASSLNYECTVQGNSINGVPFKVNRLTFVRDEFAQISSDMLIHTINFEYSLEGGSTTTLHMTFPDAYSLQAEQNARDSTRTNLAEGFF